MASLLRVLQISSFSLIDHKNVEQFIDKKNLSHRQIYQSQELLKYQFQIDYYQEKTNVAAHTLSHFYWKNEAKKETLRSKNCQILNCLLAQLIKVNLKNIITSLGSLPSHLILNYGTRVLLKLVRQQEILRKNLGNKDPYLTSISHLQL